MSWTDADVVEEVKPKQQAWTDDDIAAPEKKEQPGDRYSGAILKGVAGLAGLPGDVLTMLGKPFGDLGKPEIAQYMTKDAIVKGIEKLTGTPLYQPETAGQRYFEKAVEGAVSMPRSAATMGMGALSGLGGEFGGKVAGVPGAVLGAALPLFAPAATAHTIGGITDLVKGRTGDIRAGKVLRDAAGVKRAAIEAEMLGKGNDITAAQAAVGAGSTRWSALGDRAAQQRSEYFKALEDRQVAERAAALAGVKPDLKSAVTARDAASSPMYKQADKAVVKIDAPMMSVFERMPKGTLEAAADIARMEGRTFQIGKHIPAHTVETGVLDASGKMGVRNIPTQYPSITGESLHYVKRALSDIANASPSVKGIGRDAQSAAREVLDDFVKSFEGKVPIYGEAREAFAGASKPVNQAKVIQAMEDVLTNYKGGERVQPFLNVLGRGETALLKKSTGFPRYESGDLNKVLTPKQLDAVSKVESELLRDARLSDLATAGKADVANVLSQDASKWRLPMWLNRYVTAANKGLDIAESALNAKTMAKVYEAMESPNNALKVLNELPLTERNKVLKAMVELKNMPKSVRVGQEITQE